MPALELLPDREARRKWVGDGPRDRDLRPTD